MFNHQSSTLAFRSIERSIEKALTCVDRLTGAGGFVVSWFPQEDVMEALIKQGFPDLHEKSTHAREKTLERWEKCLKEAFSLEGSVGGFIERYSSDESISLNDLSNIKMLK